jgi:hypothetical protein
MDGGWWGQWLKLQWEFPDQREEGSGLIHVLTDWSYRHLSRLTFKAVVESAWLPC